MNIYLYIYLYIKQNVSTLQKVTKKIKIDRCVQLRNLSSYVVSNE